MSKTVSTKELAENWGVSVRRINQLCKAGAIQGVTKEGRNWRIPEEVLKPSSKK